MTINTNNGINSKCYKTQPGKSPSGQTTSSVPGTANYPKPGKTYPSPLPNPIADPSILKAAFDQLIQNRGIRFLHRKAIPCTNMNRLQDNSHDPNCPICNGNGIYFFEEKEIFGIWSSNSLEKNFEQQGVWEIGSAMVSFPTTYSDGKPAFFQTYDQLIVLDHVVRLWELKEFEDRTNGIQQLRYDISSIEYAYSIDSDNKVVQYKLDEDYKIASYDRDDIDTHGRSNTVIKGIQWIKKPAKGTIIGYSYFANPVYNILQHMREIRATQELVNGNKTNTILPQQVLVKRDFLSNPPELINGA